MLKPSGLYLPITISSKIAMVTTEQNTPCTTEIFLIVEARLVWECLSSKRAGFLDVAHSMETSKEHDDASQDGAKLLKDSCKCKSNTAELNATAFDFEIQPMTSKKARPMRHNANERKRRDR